MNTEYQMNFTKKDLSKQEIYITYLPNSPLNSGGVSMEKPDYQYAVFLGF